MVILSLLYTFHQFNAPQFQFNQVKTVGVQSYCSYKKSKKLYRSMALDYKQALVRAQFHGPACLPQLRLAAVRRRVTLSQLCLPLNFVLTFTNSLLTTVTCKRQISALALYGILLFNCKQSYNAQIEKKIECGVSTGRSQNLPLTQEIYACRKHRIPCFKQIHEIGPWFDTSGFFEVRVGRLGITPRQIRTMYMGL